MEPDPDPNDDPLNSMFPLDGDENKIVKGCMQVPEEPLNIRKYLF